MKSHGTRSRYVGGCRCAPCVQANRDYQRAYMSARYVSATNSTYAGFRRADGTVRLNLAYPKPRRLA